MRAHFELAKMTKSADSTIRGFCRLIEALPNPERRLWNRANTRDFSIGIRAGREPASADFVVGAATLKAASKLGARIVITVYAA